MTEVFWTLGMSSSCFLMSTFSFSFSVSCWDLALSAIRISRIWLSHFFTSVRSRSLQRACKPKLVINQKNSMKVIYLEVVPLPFELSRCVDLISHDTSNGLNKEYKSLSHSPYPQHQLKSVPSQRSPSTRPSLCGASHRFPWWTDSFPARKPSWGRSKSPSEIKAEFTSYPISIIQRITVFTVASFFLSTLPFLLFHIQLLYIYFTLINPICHWSFHFVVFFSFILLLNFTLLGHMCPIFFTLTPGSWLYKSERIIKFTIHWRYNVITPALKNGIQTILLCGQN